MSDLLITAALAAAALLAALMVCATEPGAGPRYVRARRYHRAGLARHARTAHETAALATIPDALNTVRTA